MLTMRRFVAATLLSGGALAACTLFVKLDEQQCAVDGDCTSRGGAFAGSVCVNQVCVAPVAEAAASDAPAGAETSVDAGIDASDAGDGAVNIWGCLSQPPEVLNPNQQITVTLTAFDALQPITTAGPSGSDLVPVAYSAVGSAAIRGCLVTDPLCSEPVATAITNDAGVATVSLPGDFVGFFDLSTPGYFPSATYPGQLLAMLQTGELQLLADALGVTMYTGLDAGVGQAFFEVYDCYDHHAAGIQFTLLGDGGPDTVQWYLSNGAPSTTATQTDSVGAGGAVNVPIGALTVRATLASTQQVIGTINPIITAGATTFAFVRVRTH
jgi:hypothetical protein